MPFNHISEIRSTHFVKNPPKRAKFKLGFEVRVKPLPKSYGHPRFTLKRIKLCNQIGTVVGFQHNSFYNKTSVNRYYVQVHTGMIWPLDSLELEHAHKIEKLEIIDPKPTKQTQDDILHIKLHTLITAIRALTDDDFNKLLKRR